MKRKYDLALGFGLACSCSQTLRRAGLQFLSFPFDWTGPIPEVSALRMDVKRRTDLICTEFKDWLAEGDFVYQGPHTNGKDKYVNTRLQYLFLHDFPQGVPLAESFPSIAAKYARRCSRLLELLRQVRTVLIVRLDRPDFRHYRTPIDDCRYAISRLSGKFPNARFDFLLLQPDETVPFEKRKVEDLGGGLTRIAFDYQDRTPGNEAFPLFKLTVAAVSQLFAVKDYRTHEEISCWKRKSRAKHYAQLGATNFLQYQLLKIKKALFGKA